MALKSHACVGLAHAAAVVGDLQERASGVIDDDVYMLGPGVQGVLHQLLEAGGGALNDLARRNLVGYTVR